MHLRKALNVCNPMYVLLLCHGLAVANDRHCAERGSDRLLLEIGVAKRHSRVAGLTAEVRLLTVGGPEAEPEQLQMMFGIPGLCLTLRCDGVLPSPDGPFMTNVLRPRGHLIDQLIIRINGDGLKLQEFCEAAAPCRSLDLAVGGSSEEPLNMAALHPVARSLVRLNLERTTSSIQREFESVSSLSLLSHLTSLSLDGFDFRAEEPWIHLVGLTDLKQLSLGVAASGDPSSLSALTGLSSLALSSCEQEVQGGLVHGGFHLGGLVHGGPCTFSSLQPLSTLQQLVELELVYNACNALTSLHGLAELSRLQSLILTAPMLKSLQGVSTGLTCLTIHSARQLVSLAGIEHLQGLRDLSLTHSGVSSLHPLAALGNLASLSIGGTFASLAGLEGNLCTSLHRLTLQFCKQLRDLSGIEGLVAVQQLDIAACEVTSLQPIGRLVGGLKKLHVRYCDEVRQVVLELPHMQPSADVSIEFSTVKEVVMAGGVRKTVGVEVEEWY